MNAVVSFVDRHLEAGHGGDLAIHTPGSSYTYDELHALINRAGNVLRTLGVEREQRVALLLRDGIEFASAFFGAIKIGAVAIPMNTRLRATDYRIILEDSRAKVLVIDASLGGIVDAIVRELPLLRSVVVVGHPTSRYLQFEELIRNAASTLRPEPVSPDDMAFWLYTSGTTGLPKAAVHVHRNLLACCHYGIDVLGATSHDRTFATSKLFFAYALGNALLIPFLARGQTFLHHAWADSVSVAEVMNRFRPTLFFSVPTFYARLLRSELSASTFSSVRLCVSAGERLPAEIYWAWRERFGVEILDGMGATETIFMVLSNRPGQVRPGSSGVAVPGTVARVLNTDEQEVPTGEQGILWVKTPSAAAGYWRRLDHSRRTFVGEWYRTGDVYCKDANGFYYHCGREDDFFKVAGMWVAPAEIEASLLEHPEVLEVGVVGAEDEVGLVKPFVFVVPRNRAVDTSRLSQDLVEFLGKKLLSHQRPKKIVAVPELPRTATGKLQRFKLREEAKGLASTSPGRT